MYHGLMFRVPNDVVVRSQNAQGDLEIFCQTCGGHVCDIEIGDLMSTIARVIDEHQGICIEK